MEDFVARRDLIDPRRLRDLSRRSDLRGAIQFFSQVGVLCLTGWAVWATWGTWWCVPVFLFHGALLWGFAYCGQHELIHRTVFRTRWANEAGAHVASLLRAFPVAYQRAFHFTHHRHTKDPGRDSEMLGAKPWTLGRYLWFMSGLEFWSTRLPALVRHALGQADEFYFQDGEKAEIVRQARLYLAFYVLIAAVSVAFQSWAAIILWVGPLFAATPFYAVITGAEHHGRPNVPNILESTRTTRANPLVNWMAWNMPWHAEHHLFPGVPFHRLPELSRELRQGAKAEEIAAANRPAPGYLSVHLGLIRDMLAGRDPVGLKSQAAE